MITAQSCSERCIYRHTGGSCDLPQMYAYGCPGGLPGERDWPATYLWTDSFNFFLTATMLVQALISHLNYSKSFLTGLDTSTLILVPNTQFPWWLRWKRICFQCGRPRFDPWVGKIPWRRAWQPTLVLLSGESPCTEEPGGLQSKWSDTTEQLSTIPSSFFTGDRMIS